MRTLSRSSRKKRQTRLAFSPVPSSSPAAEDWNDGFSTPSKRRRLESRSEGPSLGSAGADEQHIRLGTTSVPAVVVDAPSRLSELISDPSGMLPSPVKSSGVELADSHRGTCLCCWLSSQVQCSEGSRLAEAFSKMSLPTQILPATWARVNMSSRTCSIEDHISAVVQDNLQTQARLYPSTNRQMAMYLLGMKSRSSEPGSSSPRLTLACSPLVRAHL